MASANVLYRKAKKACRELVTAIKDLILETAGALVFRVLDLF